MSNFYVYTKLSDMAFDKEAIKAKSFDQFKELIAGYVSFGTLESQPSAKELKDIYEKITGTTVPTKNKEE